MIGKGKCQKLNHFDKISIVTNIFSAYTFLRLEREYQVMKKHGGKDQGQIPSVSKSKIEEVRPIRAKENNPEDLDFTLENRFQQGKSTSIIKPVSKNEKTKSNNKAAENKPRERKLRSQSLKRRVDKSTSPVQAKRITRSSSVKTPKSRKSLNVSKGKKNKK